MADCDGENDVALKVFGTPERELRRRWLRGYPDEEEEEIDSSPPDEPTQQDDQSLPERPSYTPSVTDRVVAILFHLSAAFFLIYMRLETDRTLLRIKEEQGLVMPASDTYGGRMKFLTNLNYNAQIMYFVLALLCDLLPSGRKPLEKFRDFIFTTTIFPGALVVTSMFWCLTTFLPGYAVGPVDGPVSLMLNALPPHVNHAMHTAVGVVVVIEALLVYHSYTSNSDAIKTMFIWNTSYALWIYWCYYYAGTLPYLFFVNLGPYFMPLAFLLFLLASIASYFLGKTITFWSWAGEVN